MDSIINAAIQYLSERHFSEKSLRAQLAIDFKGLANLESQINLTIARLKELLLINDSRLAENLSQRFSHRGNDFIKQTLQQRGISEEIIVEILASLDDEPVRALQEARKKCQLLQAEGNGNSNPLLRRFLTGRGFSSRAIQSAINQLTQEQSLYETRWAATSYPTTSGLINRIEGKSRSSASSSRAYAPI